MKRSPLIKIVALSIISILLIGIGWRYFNLHTKENEQYAGKDTPANDKIIRIQSRDKKNETVYSTLVLNIPNESSASIKDITIVSLAATKFDKYLGGSYMVKAKSPSFSTPVDVAITYTDEAVNLYKKTNTSLNPSKLTLAYFDRQSFTYKPITSKADAVSQTVSGKISTPYPDGLVIIVDTSK